MSHAQPSDVPSDRNLPPDTTPPPGRGAGQALTGQPTFDEFDQIHRSEDFALLRGKFRRFAFPWTVAFLVWYFLYVLLSVYAKDLMATPVIGNVNLGILLGLLQFVTTFGLTWLYIRHANKSLDPIVTRIQERVGDAGRADSVAPTPPSHPASGPDSSAPETNKEGGR